jgi:hypothetical protein
MQIMKRALFAILLTCGMLLIAGCPTQASIGDIQKDPSRYYNKEVTISGTVVNSFGALGSGAYEMDDGTGRMWVVSENYGVPNKGANFHVAGTVVDTVSFAGRSFATALRETQRRKY